MRVDDRGSRRLPFAALGVAVARPRAIVPVLLCAIASLIFAILGNPTDVARPVLVPLVPLLVVLATSALAELARSPAFAALAARRGSSAA